VVQPIDGGPTDTTKPEAKPREKIMQHYRT
jgi:hypothetical protein